MAVAGRSQSGPVAEDSTAPAGPVDGQVAVVTGGGRGFGRSIAEALSAAGCRVVVAARTSDELDETADAIRAAGGDAIAVTTDVSDPESVARLRARTLEAFGPASILVHAAGVLWPFGPVWEDPEAWWAAHAIHVRGAVQCMHEFVPDMIEAGGGRVIVISSSASQHVRPNHSGYHVPKSTQNQIVAHLAEEGRPHGVFTWAVHPGWVATGMASYALNSSSALQYAPDVVDAFRDRSTDEAIAEGLERCGRFCTELAAGGGDAVSGRYLVATEDLAEQVRRAQEGSTRKLLRRVARKSRRWTRVGATR